MCIPGNARTKRSAKRAERPEVGAILLQLYGYGGDRRHVAKLQCLPLTLSATPMPGVPGQRRIPQMVRFLSVYITVYILMDSMT